MPSQNPKPKVVKMDLAAVLILLTNNGADEDHADALFDLVALARYTGEKGNATAHARLDAFNRELWALTTYSRPGRKSRTAAVEAGAGA